MSKRSPVVVEDSAPRGRAAQGARSRARLVEAARALFERDGYSRTSTEGLLAATGLTRGALYHHFRDKKDVFLAVCDQMHAELGLAIEAATQELPDPCDQLVAGSLAWIEAISRPGARQVLLVDAPSVLSEQQSDELDARHGFRELREVVGEILTASSDLSPADIDSTAAALNGAINALAQWLARVDTAEAQLAASRSLRRICGAVLDAPHRQVAGQSSAGQSRM